MPWKKIAVFLIGMLSIMSLAACQQGQAETLALVMELDANYDDADPFVDERLFYVSKDLDRLEAEGTIRLEGADGILAIKNNQTDEILWQKTWTERTDEERFSISLENVQKDNEYALSFTGTQIEHAKITVTFASPLVKERERPAK